MVKSIHITFMHEGIVVPILKRKNGLSLFYQFIDKTPNQGECCLLLGGLTRDHTIWRKLLPLLQPHFQLLIMDNRDVGQSSSDIIDYDIADMAEDVNELIEQLQVYSLHIIGHSMGGFIAQYVAAYYPQLVKTLTLCSTAPRQVPSAITYLNNRIQFLQNTVNATTASREDIIAAMSKLYSPMSLLDKAWVEEIITHETTNPFPQKVASFKRQANACIHHDATHLLDRITCPTLILTGEQDPYYTPESLPDFAAKIKNAQTAVIPHAAHMVQLEQPLILANLFTDFIYGANHEF